MSIGDWQHRYDEPGNAYWEKEAYRFHLAAGPDWLRIDEATGLLHGTPPPGTTGTTAVTVSIETTFPHEIPEDGTQAKAFRVPTAQRAGQAEHHFELTVTP